MNRVFVFLLGFAFAVAACRELAFVLPDQGLVLYPASPDLWLLRPHHVASIKELADTFTHPVPVDDKGAPIPPMKELTTAIFARAKASILDVALPLVGGMMLFLGLMKIVEQGGGLAIVARLIRPIMVALFPDVPPNHPAMGAMIMNIAANALGLGNAATPFGIKAMHELDKLNPHKGTATNAMALFLTINTACVTLLATGVINQRIALGSRDPAAIQMTTLFAGLLSTVCGVIVCLALARLSPPPPATDPIDATATEAVDDGYPAWVSALTVGSFVALFLVVMPGAALWAPAWVDAFNRWMIPALIVLFVGFGFARGVAVYEVFVQGAREGWDIAVRVMPYLVAILVAVAMFQSSGAFDLFASAVGPATSRVGLPPEALPMALIRPLSGSGASGVMMATMNDPATGPDTYVGYLVSTIQGSSETTFYVLSVYFGAIGVNRMRHTLPAALFADVVGVVGSILAVQAYFRFVLERTP